MAILDITSYRDLARAGKGESIMAPQEPAISNLQVAIGGASAASAVFPDGTRLIRVHTDEACRVEIAVAPVAAATSKRMAAGATEFFGATAGLKIAVIADA
jgi:hypothetical protein